MKSFHVDGLFNDLGGSRYLEQAESLSRFIWQAKSIVQGGASSLTVVMVQHYATPEDARFGSVRLTVLGIFIAHYHR